MTSDQRLVNYFIFYVATLLFFGVGAITTLGMGWYGTLVTPSFMPATLVVAAIWCLLFLLTGLSVSRFWEQSPKDAAFGTTISLFMGNAALVLLWNYLFFGVHHLMGAVWASVAVALTVAVLMLRLWKGSRTASLLLAPYLLWVVWAIGLTYSLMQLNP